MKKLFLLVLLTGLLYNSVNAQNKLTEYTTGDGKMILHAGDTIQFLKGSLGGRFVHVFFLVGTFQRQKATFSTDYYSELIIDHFIKKKENGVVHTYAVMNIPNKPKWEVWALLDDALNQNEIKLKHR